MKTTKKTLKTHIVLLHCLLQLSAFESMLNSLSYCIVSYQSFHSVTMLMWEYHGGSPTAVQAWQTCPVWEPSPSHPILV